jgi:hypothetical protein
MDTELSVNVFVDTEVAAPGLKFAVIAVPDTKVIPFPAL